MERLTLSRRMITSTAIFLSTLFDGNTGLSSSKIFSNSIGKMKLLMQGSTTLSFV